MKFVNYIYRKLERTRIYDEYVPYKIKDWIGYLTRYPRGEGCQKPLGDGSWCGRGHNHPGNHKAE